MLFIRVVLQGARQHGGAPSAANEAITGGGLLRSRQALRANGQRRRFLHIDSRRRRLVRRGVARNFAFLQSRLTTDPWPRS
jgi:hypothetical protein